MYTLVYIDCKSVRIIIKLIFFFFFKPFMYKGKIEKVNEIIREYYSFLLEEKIHNYCTP